MANYFQYLKEFLSAFFSNLGQFFADTFGYPWSKVPGEFYDYNSLLSAYSEGFGFWGWFFYVLFLLLFIGLLGGIVFFIVIFVRKYVKFYKKQVSVEKMQEQIENLNYELYQALTEKDRILGLHFEGVAGKAPATQATEEGEKTEEEAKDAHLETRFPRLTLVDSRYETPLPPTELPPDAQNISLVGICERFRNFACSQMGLYYTPEVVRQFFAAMGTGKIIILEGISGTGKTSLPYCLGRFFKHNTAICSVQPSWHDRSELLGYYNDFTHKFTETEFLRAIYEATYRDDINLVVLDEMNLARIEYYFAEFLSIMEMPNVNEWNINLVAAPAENDPKHLRDGRLLIPQNVWFVGTANNDDSTFTITDKVYDRAMSLFFDNKGLAFEAPFTDALPIPYHYFKSLFDQAMVDHPLSETTLAKFQELDAFVIDHFKLAFGNRIMKQLGLFVPCYVGCGGTELEAVDYVFCSKILKKFEVLNVGFLRDELLALDKELIRLFGKGEFALSHKKIKGFLKQSQQ